MIPFLSTLLVLFVVITVHELGHAYAMRRNGIRIARMTIGIPIPYLNISFGTKMIREIRISPFLIMGLVEPSEFDQEKLQTLPYLESSFINGAGILVNIVTILVIMLAVQIIAYCAGNSLHSIAFFAEVVGLVVMLYWRKYFCAYVLPIVGICVLLVRVSHGLGMTLVPDIWEIAYTPIALIPFHFLGIGLFKATILLSGVVATFNAIPLFPLDGGRTMQLIVRRLFTETIANYYSTVTVLCVLCMVLYSWLFSLWSW